MPGGCGRKRRSLDWEVVKRKVTSLFPGPASAEILDMLDVSLPTTQGLQRLQLALLKLSDGNVDELRRLVQNVTSESGLKSGQDIRIIARAEWPEADQIGRASCRERV